MRLQLLKASTTDALILNDISKRAFDSDILIGAPSLGGPPWIYVITIPCTNGKTRKFV